jgi:hypothetical protein
VFLLSVEPVLAENFPAERIAQCRYRGACLKSGICRLYVGHFIEQAKGIYLQCPTGFFEDGLSRRRVGPFSREARSSQLRTGASLRTTTARWPQ